MSHSVITSSLLYLRSEYKEISWLQSHISTNSFSQIKINLCLISLLFFTFVLFACVLEVFSNELPLKLFEFSFLWVLMMMRLFQFLWLNSYCNECASLRIEYMQRTLIFRNYVMLRKLHIAVLRLMLQILTKSKKIISSTGEFFY
jgi:hypothetical protein